MRRGGWLRRVLGRRRRDERGAVAVEAALVFPLLVMLVFGLVEMSFLLRDYASVAGLSRTGVRVASTGADRGPGTCYTYTNAPVCTSASAPALAQLAADAIQRAGSALPPDQVKNILVYKANSAGYPGAEGNRTLPDSCAGITACVEYRWVASQDAFRWVSGSTWDSTSISACFPGTTARPLDSVGVYVRATHKMVTGLFGAGIPMNDGSFLNFEPVATQSCAAGQHP